MNEDEEIDDAAQQHAWSISARLAALAIPLEGLPGEVADLVHEARGLHPQMNPANQFRDKP